MSGSFNYEVELTLGKVKCPVLSMCCTRLENKILHQERFLGSQLIASHPVLQFINF